MITKKFTKKTQFNIIQYGNNLFLLGSFFLATAPFLSAIFFIPSLVIGSIKRNDKFLEDKWNYPLIAVSILMIISCIVQTNPRYNTLNLDTSLFFIDLFNWIPLFWCFWGFQPYLTNKKLRKKFLFIVLAGSIPVLISGLSQYFFRWYGPFDALNGLIIWYQRPIVNDQEGITALFSSQPYAGSWLSMIFFISLAFTIVKENKRTTAVVSLVISFFTLLTTIFTYSRNAILSISFFLFFFFKSKRLTKFIIFFIISIIYINFIFGENIFLVITNLLLNKLQGLSNNGLIPEALFVKINSFLNLGEIKSFPRFLIWEYSIDLVTQKSLFGWGAGSFSKLFNLNDFVDFNGQHTHNLPLQIALNYGLPSALILTVSSLLITFENFKNDFKVSYLNRFSKENIFDTAWKTAIGIFLFSHIFDITYFDGRISILSWILFAGMRNMLKD